MAKLGCICGHIIRDQTTDLPYKAKFMRDQDLDKYWDYSIDVASFVEAIKVDKRDEWIRAYFSETYPTQIDNSSVIFDIVSFHGRDISGDIYQCENCGRVKIQLGDTNIYSSFLPEDERYRDLFKGISPK